MVYPIAWAVGEIKENERGEVEKEITAEGGRERERERERKGERGSKRQERGFQEALLAPRAWFTIVNRAVHFPFLYVSEICT